MIQYLATQGFGGTAVPFRRNANNVLQRPAYSPMDALRIKRYEEHWRFYQGQQWSFQRETNDTLVQANYCRTLVNKKASWLVGKGQILDVPKPLTGVTLPILLSTWKDNNESMRLFEIAITGGVTGDVFILLGFEPPTPEVLSREPNSRGHIRIRVIPPERVFPVWDPKNTEKLLSVKIVTDVPREQSPQEVENIRQIRGANDTTLNSRRYVEVITAQTIKEGYEDIGFEERPNDLGEIPLVHIANELFPGEFYGLSDLDGVIDLQRELNEKLTDVSDIVNYHSAPITIITGAKAKNLQKDAKQIWSGLPAEAKVYNLELGSDLPAAHKYLELIRQVLFDIGNLPEGSLGRIQPISNTSAAALEVAFQPLVEATDRKKATYVPGLQKVNYFILRIYQLLHQLHLPADLCGKCGGRIVTYKAMGRDGVERMKQRCYMIDPQTLDYLHPDDVKVSVTIEHSFGNEVRKMPFGQVKAMWGKKHPSYWDPEPMVDKEKQAKLQKEHEETKQEEAKQEMQGQAEDQHSREMEQIAAKKPPPKEPAQ